MIKTGITGGMGSGKSVVSEIFRLHGVPVYNADLEAKKLSDSSPLIRERLTSELGEALYADGRLDRKKLASLIFNDQHKLSIVNSVIHGQLAEHFIEWSRRQEDHPMILLDAPLLIESGFYRLVDKTVVVCAPKELRIERVMQRDQLTRSEIEARMNNQLPDEEKMKYADYVICNDNSVSLILQVSSLMDSLSSLCLPG